MKTRVTDTSLASYDALRTSGFKGQHATILNRMQPGKPYSRRQIAMQTGLETSAVAGRVNELLERRLHVIPRCMPETMKARPQRGLRRVVLTGAIPLGRFPRAEPL